MKDKTIQEIRERKQYLMSEIDAIDAFLSFYEKKDSAPIPHDITLRRACVTKLMSVRLSNALNNYYGKEKFEIITLGQVKLVFGVPIDPEVKIALLRHPNTGRKAINELECLLQRVDSRWPIIKD